MSTQRIETELSANADAGCNRKVYYSNECLANKARKTMQRLHGTRFLYYECKECGGFHVANDRQPYSARPKHDGRLRRNIFAGQIAPQR